MNQALEEFKDDATVTDSQNKLNLRTENDLLDGMVVRLLPHQIIGVAWMVDQVGLLCMFDVVCLAECVLGEKQRQARWNTCRRYGSVFNHTKLSTELICIHLQLAGLGKVRCTAFLLHRPPSNSAVDCPDDCHNGHQSSTP